MRNEEEVYSTQDNSIMFWRDNRAELILKMLILLKSNGVWQDRVE